MARKKTVESTTKQYTQSKPEIPSRPIQYLNLDAIVNAVRICRELTSIEGARQRWALHPLYPDAVAVLDGVDDHGITA